jgi:uncharacterized protein YjbI with pentapeptide repeats
MSPIILRQKGGTIDAAMVIQALNWGSIELYGRCIIEGDLVFSSDVNSDISIKNCSFNGEVNFNSVSFNKDIDFSGSIFNEKANFGGSRFKECVKFVDADFMKSAHFDCTIFYKNVDFDFASFYDDVSFNDARFPTSGYNQIIEFNHAIFQGAVAFTNIAFESNYNLNTGKIKNTNALVKRLHEAPDLSQPWWWNQKKDPVSSFIKSNYLKDSGMFLNIYNEKSNGIELVIVLNKLISESCLFELNCFKNAAKKETQEVIKRNPNRTRYHNRLLLADAYPKLIDSLIVIRIGFMNAKFHGVSNFSNSKFIEVDFRDTMFYDKTMFCYSEFKETANFSGATFDRNANFYRSSFCGKAIFTGAIFERDVNWRKSKFNWEILLIDTKINSMQFEKAFFNDQAKIFLNGSHFSFLIIPWNIINKILFKNTEMDATYLSLIKSYKELGWWNDADECSFQYNIYKNKSKLVKKLISIQPPPYLDYFLNTIKNSRLIKTTFFKIDDDWSLLQNIKRKQLKANSPRFTDIASWLCGYGIRIEYLIWSTLLIILISGLFFNFINHPSESMIDSMMNSSLLFLSGTVGNLSPPYNYVVAFESLFRSLILSIFIVILTRKMFR